MISYFSTTKLKKGKISGLLAISLFVLVILITLTVVILGTAYHLFYQAGNQADDYVNDFVPKTTLLQDGKYRGHFEVFDAVTAADVEFRIKQGRVIYFVYHDILSTPNHPSPQQIKTKIEKSKILRFDSITGASRVSSFTRAAIKKAILNGVTKDKIGEQKRASKP